jgi:DNA-binding MarR family transcriptional regulator
MSADLSNDERLILQRMWELKAVGTRAVAVQDLLSRVLDLSKTETSERLRGLEARGLVTITDDPEGERFALSPLGAAYVRQLQEKKLGDLTSGR